MQRLVRGETHVILVWESLTYPSVACLGGILQKHLKSGFRAVVATIVTSLLEATTVEVRNEGLNATCLKIRRRGEG
jgi:hypothetical protein